MKKHFVIRLSLASVCLMFSFRAKAQLTTKKTLLTTNVPMEFPDSRACADEVSICQVEGRPFTTKEVIDDARVIIINKSMARRYWPNESAINKRVEHLNAYDTVVGVTDDVRHLGLGVTPPPMYYTPMNAESTFTVLIRTSQDPLSLAPAVRSRIRAIDDNVAINWMQPMETLVRASFAEQRYRTLLITAFALSAAFLALIGLY